MNAAVRVEHELVKMRASLAPDCGRREKQVHQHGLAAADFAVEVKALDGTVVRRTAAQQPAERGGFVRQPMPREPRFERREPGDQSFLAGVALDLACCQERAIPLANRADHAGINSEGVGGGATPSPPLPRRTRAYLLRGPCTAAKRFGRRSSKAISAMHFRMQINPICPRPRLRYP